MEDYKAAFNILMKYWDYIPKEERHIVDQKLKIALDYELTTADEFNKGVNLDQNGTLTDVSPNNGPVPFHKIKEALNRLKYNYGYGIKDS